MHQILWLLYIAIIWYKKSTSLPKLDNKNVIKINSTKQPGCTQPGCFSKILVVLAKFWFRATRILLNGRLKEKTSKFLLENYLD